MKLLLTTLLLVYFITTTAQEVVPETPLDTIVLNEVIVKAQRKTQYTDKASFTFEKKSCGTSSLCQRPLAQFA